MSNSPILNRDSKQNCVKSVLKKEIQNPGEITGDVVTCQELEKANLVINQFIKSCSHAMRGPLKSIRGLVNILKDRNPTTDLDPAVVIRFIEENTEKMEIILEELEQFMFNSSQETKNKSIDLDELVLQVTTNFQKEIKKQAIDVTIQIQQPSPFYSDPARIRLILGHLLTNAITFQKAENPNKKISIQCSVALNECVLAVEDNGIGIESDQHGNIFEIFYQATSNPHGSGIGLFIVREALEKMRGTITIDSQPGQGSIFKFTLPNLAVKVGQQRLKQT